MKFLAVLQIVCILFLSSYSGVAKAVAQPVKFDCCKKLNKPQNCKHQPSEKDNCASTNCGMLLTCGICAYLTVEPTIVKPTLATNIEKPVTIYKIGNAAGYFSSDWKPPKI
jgi:hypothetical protein